MIHLPSQHCWGPPETILGPIWVWVFLNEVPSQRTIIGGSIVLTALIAYLLWQMVEQRRMKRLAPPVH
ncbi:MAG: hypothetical protein R3D34_08845 [Nitratireductor sp.]